MDVNLVEVTHYAHLVLIVFLIGYLAIIIEETIKFNKGAAALLMAIACWTILFEEPAESADRHLYIFSFQMFKVSQIIFFLIGALIIVEIINAHRGFHIITRFLMVRSKQKMLWLTGFFTFFLSSVLDNLTTTIVMISMMSKLIPEKEERYMLGGIIVIAANVGGAWTPIGDVATTLLWINEQITTWPTIRDLFLPSLSGLVACLLWFSPKFKGQFVRDATADEFLDKPIEPGGTLVLILGICLLIFVPILKILTNLPPFMGMMLGVGILWVVTDLMHSPFKERQHLRVTAILPRIDMTVILFYLGVLLAVNALESAGLLKQAAQWLNLHVNNLAVIPILIGLVSSLVDNVSLLAATIGMFKNDPIPPDSFFWQTIAYAAGTGGSILIIGSAAGVALMALERVSFMWYLKKITIPSLLTFSIGIICYFLLSPFTKIIF